MDSLFHGPNSIEYYSTIFLLGVSLWGTWSSLPYGRRSESIVVTKLNLEMKAWHLGRPRGLTVMDQLSSVVKMQKGDVSFRLTAEVKQVCQSLQWPLTGNVNSAIQPHLSITTLPTDTQSTTGDSWPWQRTWILACLFNPLMSKNSTRCYQVMYCSVVRLLMPWCWDNRTRSSASTWLKCALYSTHKWHNKIHF